MTKMEIFTCPHCGRVFQSAHEWVHCPYCDQVVQTKPSGPPPPPVAQPLNALPDGGTSQQPWVGVLLSLLCPGLGQIVRGRPADGTIFLVAAIVGYAICLIPGVAVHIWAIVDAMNDQPVRAFDRWFPHLNT